MAGSPNLLYEALDELLTFSAAALDLIPTYPETAGLEGAPALRYISPGLPAVDCCPAMWTYSGPLTPAGTSPQRAALDAGHKQVFNRVNLPTLNVLVMRCTPTFEEAGGVVTFPPADDVSASARQVYADGWTLWSALLRGVKAGTIFSRCTDAFFDSAMPQDPSGGCAGWLMSMRVNVPGFDIEVTV